MAGSRGVKRRESLLGLVDSTTVRMVSPLPFYLGHEPRFCWGQQDAERLYFQPSSSDRMACGMVLVKSYKQKLLDEESPLGCGDGNRRRRSTDAAISCRFSLSTSFILAKNVKEMSGKKRGQPLLCREESQEITKNLAPNILRHGSKISSHVLPDCSVLKKKRTSNLRLCFWGLCSSQPNIIPSPQTRQHFISIINLEIVCQILACTRVSRSKFPFERTRPSFRGLEILS